MNFRYALVLLLVPILNTACSGGFKALDNSQEMKLDASSLQAPSISPSIISEKGGTLLTIIGKDFTSEVVVTIGASPCTSLKVLDSTKLTCITPATNSGNQTVQVKLANGSLMAAPVAVSSQAVDPLPPTAPPVADQPPVSNPPAVSNPPPATNPPPKKSCPIAFGSGEQTLVNGVYGPCIAISCQSGYNLVNGKCEKDPVYLTVEACPSTLPRGYATTISIGDRDLHRITVSDGTNVILDKDVTIPENINLPVSPSSATTYTVVGYRDGVKRIEKTIKISVYDINDPIFPKSPTPITVVRQPNGYRLSWANQTVGLDYFKLSFKNAIGTAEYISVGYNPMKAATMDSWFVNPGIPTQYALFACKGSGFSSELTEMATVNIVPPTPRLSPEPGQAADCLGVARYIRNGKYEYQRLFGGGNFNSTQAAATVQGCYDIMQKNHQDCLKAFGPSCKTTGYLAVKDSQVNSSSTLRIYSSDAPQMPTFPLASAGVCYNSYYTNSTKIPVVDSGDDYVVSTSQSALTEDCTNLNWYNAFEINVLSPGGNLDGAQVIGTKKFYLVEVPSNTVLANKSYPRP
jgi:hypothetical protein